MKKQKTASQSRPNFAQMLKTNQTSITVEKSVITSEAVALMQANSRAALRRQRLNPRLADVYLNLK